MENVKFAIPQWALDIAIDGLQDLARRQEADAAAFARMNTPDSLAQAEELLQQAKENRKGYEFYIHL